MVNDFLAGLQIFDLSPGAMSTKNCESDFCQLVFTHGVCLVPSLSSKFGLWADVHKKNDTFPF